VNKLIGWFSAKQKVLLRANPVVYLDINGNEVECTDVRREDRGKPLFNDAVCLGEVTKFVRQVNEYEDTMDQLRKGN